MNWMKKLLFWQVLSLIFCVITYFAGYYTRASSDSISVVIFIVSMIITFMIMVGTGVVEASSVFLMVAIATFASAFYHFEISVLFIIIFSFPCFFYSNMNEVCTSNKIKVLVFFLFLIQGSLIFTFLKYGHLFLGK